jgi:hypothetical protein
MRQTEDINGILKPSERSAKSGYGIMKTTSRREFTHPQRAQGHIAILRVALLG